MKNQARSAAVSRFWSSLQPTIPAMFLKPGADEVDRLERAEILSYLPCLQGKRVLDLAAGIGRYTGVFAQTAAQVVSVDLIASFIEESRRLNAAYSNIEYRVADAMDLVFDPGSFDLIFLNSLLMYLEDDEVALLVTRLSQWLKGSGLLFTRDSCAAVFHKNTSIEGYFAIYRTMRDIARFFQPPWRLVAEGNLRTFEALYADPFKCFWLFELCLSSKKIRNLKSIANR